MPQKRWIVRNSAAAKATDSEKAAIVAACDRFVAEVLKPRFLPQIHPTKFNYPVDIYGKWHGGRYRFIQRYRSGFSDNAGWEFESAFARLDYLGLGRFDVMWHRHTGQWFRLYRSISLNEALRCVEEDGHLHPV